MHSWTTVGSDSGQEAKAHAEVVQDLAALSRQAGLEPTEFAPGVHA